MIREVPLTQGYVALVDGEDYDAVMAAGPWCASVKGGDVYALRGSRRSDGHPTTIRMHNFITGWRFVDHINGDGIDNRRANLRPADHLRNNYNRGKASHNTSGYKGVTWHKAAGKWCAQIRAESRHHYLGLYVDAAEAAAAYDAAAIELHGEFAVLNFPQETAA